MDVLATVDLSQSLSATQWPAETDVVLSFRSRKVKLNLLHPLLHDVVKDGMENMRGFLLFDNAFLDAALALTFATDSLMTAAEDHYPEATNIQWCFNKDPEYFVKFLTVVFTLLSEKPT